MAESVIESAKTGCFETAALIRGPPQAEVTGAAEADAEGAREGKAVSDRVSKSTFEATLTLVLVGAASPKEGNGSGAPSSSCLLYMKRSTK